MPSMPLPEEDPQQLPARIDEALHALLRRSPEDPHPVTGQARTARGWLDVAHEAAYADDLLRAERAVDAGFLSPGGQRPEHRLALWRTLATLQVNTEREAEAQASVARRAEVLRELNQARQADLEEQLGALLIRQPDGFAATVLEGVAEDERTADQLDTVLPDVLATLAVHRVGIGQATEAVDLLNEALEWTSRRRDAQLVMPTEQETGLRMFLAHAYLMNQDGDDADDTAQQLLSTGANRAVRAAMWMVRAVVAHHRSQPGYSAGYALSSVQLYSALGMRSGAASAAGLLATVADDMDESHTATLAWKVAVSQAEQGEIPETSALLLALGHHLVQVEKFAEAQHVLARLVRREESAGDQLGLARALVDLGHAMRYQDQPAQALEHWLRAAEMFRESGALEDSARVLLASGALLSREQRDDEAVARLSQAVDLARQADDSDPAVLAQALHALGHVLSERGEQRGVDLLDEAIALAKGAHAQWHYADYTDTRARALWALDQGGDAVSTALTAADLYTASDDPTSAQQSELFAAHVLLERKMAAEASSLFRILAEEETNSRSVRLAAWMGLSQALDLTGDRDASIEARFNADELADAPTLDDDAAASPSDDSAPDEEAQD